MLKESKQGFLDYQKLSKEEMEQRGILGRLVGVCADFINPTRNGRKYSEDLWEGVFNNDIMKEKIANKVCYGELAHPLDREETDPEKIAVCLAEQPKKGADGKLYAVFDILNTPNGKILKTLCDYGSTLGVSSRGSGDLYIDNDGDEAVDPSTYNCEAFDIVLVPAVKAARLKYVTESLDKTRYNKSLRQKLTEQLESASKEDREVMEDTLKNLDIDLEEKPAGVAIEDNQEGVLNEDVENEMPEEGKMEEPEEFVIDSVETSNKFLDDTSTKLDLLYNFIEENQESLISEEELIEKFNSVINKFTAILELIAPKKEEEKVIDIEPEEEVVDDMSDEVTAELQEALLKIKELEKDNLSLQEKLSVSNAKEVQIEEEIVKYRNAMISLSESAKNAKNLNNKVEQLTESLNKKDKLLVSNRTKLDEMLEVRNKSNKQLDEAVTKISSLENELTSLNEKLEDANKNINYYKEKVIKLSKALKESKDLYLQTKAESYGLELEDVKSRLTESYSTKDVDLVCEQLSDQARRLKTLPFNYGKVRITEAKTSGDYIVNNLVNTDDEISDTLLNLIN